MKAELLGVALTLTSTCLLLWLRQMIVAIGRKRGVPLADLGIASRHAESSDWRERPIRSAISIVAARTPDPSPIQVEEFLAELRTKSAAAGSGALLDVEDSQQLGAQNPVRYAETDRPPGNIYQRRNKQS